MKLKRIIWPVVIAVAIGGGIAWKLSSNKKTMQANAAVANQKNTVFPVLLTSPATVVLSQNVDVTGRFTPIHELDLVSEASGRIVSLAHRNGDAVGKGSIVVQLDDEQIVIDLKLAQANLDKAVRDLDSYREMLRSNAVNKQEVVNAELNVVTAETRVATLKRQLKATKIVTTISGTINNMNLEVGSYLTPGTRIAQIADLGQLTMVVKMQPADVVRVRRGQRIKVVADEYANDTLNGTVSAIGTIADGARKYDVEINVPNSAKTALLAGMTGRAIFEYNGTRTSLVVPSKSIVGSLQDPHVYVVDNNVATLVPVTIGVKQGDMVEVRSGITAAQRVVESGQVGLTSGAKVQIVN